MDDLLREFLTETAESLARLDVELVKLEQTPNDTGLLGSIFRLVHTIKGTCGFIGLPRLERVAHASENVLGKFRDGVLPVTPQAVTLILKSIDAVKNIVGALEATGAEPAGDDGGLIAELNAMASGQTAAETPPPQASTPPSAPVPDEFGFVPVPAGDMTMLMANMGQPADVVPAAAPAPPPPPPPVPAVAKPEDQTTRESSIAAQTIRVGVDLLEKLMTMVSELVLTRNQLLQIVRNQKIDADFTAPLQRLNQITSTLQDDVMKTRMQPIGNAWSKLPRIVRDLSVELNKKIDLQMHGAETELDRQVLELIKDPLTHMVRNSGDHGIEMPADRIKAGKPETGVIRLDARHEGGHIIIEITDDGRGLAIDKIKAKAVQNGLATEAELAAMSDQQIMQFIFKPGFSTATKVTSVSGRGVGMDVVRTNIEKIGGTVEMQSAMGQGSRFLIKIPLTLAIISALIVACDEERFAIPQINITELVRATATSEHRLEYINETPVLRLRDRLLPLVSLRRIFKFGDGAAESAAGVFVVVVQAGNADFGIIVDGVRDTEEIVVKPVSPVLRNIGMFSGNTILGDGTVVMILDLNGIAALSSSAHGGMGSAQKIAVKERVSTRENQQSLLLFRSGKEAPKAVPLALVTRLEEIERAAIEFSNGVPVVQYRGSLIPLVPIDSDTKIKPEGRQPTLIFSDQGRSIGLMVDKIIDVVEDQFQIDLSTRRLGYLGTSIIAGKATDIIDVSHFLSQASEDWFGIETAPAYGAAETHRLLLVEDSPFFRNLLVPLLTAAGYDVTAVENPAQALKLEEAGENFDAIISDIEMPGMNGFDFATTVRRGAHWSQVPMLALSSHATPQDVDRGLQAGFNDYVAKFNRDALLTSLRKTLHPTTPAGA